MKKQIKVLMMALFCIGLSFGMNKKAKAMEDGAYVIPITFSYVNPDTNQTEDGSSNIALGESMISSMLQKSALLEQVNGKTYVTVGIGMMSNVSNVRIKVQNQKGGSYSQTSVTKTGSNTLNGDTCNHYRFQIKSQDGYISPILYIEPMGRDVQFFIGLSMGSAKKGTGIYKSLMVPVATATPVPTKKPTATPAITKKPEETPAATKRPEVTKEPDVTKEPAATKTPEVTKEPDATKQPEVVETTNPAEQEETSTPQMDEAVEEDNSNLFLISIIAISVLGSGILIWFNKKGGRHE